MGCTQQVLVLMTSLLILFYVFVHAADVVFLGVFVSTAICHHLFSVVAGIHLMAIGSSSLSGSTVFEGSCSLLLTGGVC